MKPVKKYLKTGPHSWTRKALIKSKPLMVHQKAMNLTRSLQKQILLYQIQKLEKKASADLIKKELKKPIYQKFPLLKGRLQYDQMLVQLIEKAPSAIPENTLDQKIAVFTAISGQYDFPKVHWPQNTSMDFFVFSDLNKVSLPFYKQKRFTKSYSPIKQVRWVKTHPHELLKDYDLVIWLDSSIALIRDIGDLLRQFVESNSPVGFFKHPYRDDVFEEAYACQATGKDDFQKIEDQMQKYRRKKFTTRYLGETGVLLLNLNSDKTSQFLNDWWNEIDMGSIRDQLSLNFALEVNSIHPWLIGDDSFNVRNHPSFALLEHGVSNQLEQKVFKEWEQVGLSY